MIKVIDISIFYSAIRCFLRYMTHFWGCCQHVVTFVHIQIISIQINLGAFRYVNVSMNFLIMSACWSFITNQVAQKFGVLVYVHCLGDLLAFCLSLNRIRCIAVCINQVFTDSMKSNKLSVHPVISSVQCMMVLMYCLFPHFPKVKPAIFYISFLFTHMLVSIPFFHSLYFTSL